MQISKKVGFRYFHINSISQMKTTLFIIVIITEKQDDLNVFIAKGNYKVYFLQSSITLKITTEKSPALFWRETMPKGKIDVWRVQPLWFSTFPFGG